MPLLLLALVAGAARRRASPTGRSAAGGSRTPGCPCGRPSDDPARPASSVAGIAATVLPSVVSIEVATAQGQATGSGLRPAPGRLPPHQQPRRRGRRASRARRSASLFSDGSEEPADDRGPHHRLRPRRPQGRRAPGSTRCCSADSDDVVVGDAVVAIGAPLGLEGTVTTGIVSALNRPVQAGADGERAFINAIQTDAAINPGNSGGPLVNGAGEVIGINSAIAQPPNGLGAASGSIGLGFAIPSNQARRTAEELIETGAATYPIIGVLLDESYTGEGVQVAAEPSDEQAPVTPDGPADNAGIRPGRRHRRDRRPPGHRAGRAHRLDPRQGAGGHDRAAVRTGDEEREVRVVLDQATSD